MKKKYMMAACACMSCVLLGSGTYVYKRCKIRKSYVELSWS